MSRSSILMDLAVAAMAGGDKARTTREGNPFGTGLSRKNVGLSEKERAWREKAAVSRSDQAPKK